MVARRQEHSDYNRQTESSKKRVRLTFDLDDGLRRRIKLQALKNDLTINEYLTRVLDDVVPVEESYEEEQWRPVTQKTLDLVDKIRAELMEGREGKPFEDSVETIRQMREERTKYSLGEE